MAKFYGKVGYISMNETVPGVFKEVEQERFYKGNVIRNTRRWQPNEHLNDDLVVSNQISIVADDFAYRNLHYIRYVWWMNTRWKVTTVDINRPRLILTIGEVYNG